MARPTPLHVAAALLLLPATAAAEPPRPLTADLVAREALRSNPLLDAAEAELAAAESGVDEALIAFFPRVSAGTRWSQLSREDSSVPGLPVRLPQILDPFSASVTVVAPLSDEWLRIAPAHTAARHLEGAARLGLRATVRDVETDARLVYWTWVRARLSVEVAAQAQRQAQEHLRDLRALEEQGAASRADVLRVESQVAAAEASEERARHLDALFEDRLRVLLDAPSNQTFAIGDDLEAETTHPRPLPAQPEARVQRRPELQALAHQAAAQDALADIAQAGVWPRLAAFAELTVANPNPRVLVQRDELESSWAVGIEASWSVNDLAAALASSAGARQRAVAVRARREAARDAAHDELVQAVQARGDAQRRRDATQRGLVAAEESYRVRQVLFREGRATSAELTDAETELTRARLDALDARIDRRVAAVRFAHAIGE